MVFMKISSLSLASILVTSCAISMMPLASFAQDFPTSDNRDPFSRAASGDTSGLMQLINRAQSNGRPVSRSAQNQQIDAAAEDFRQRQIRAWQERKNKTKVITPATPGTTMPLK
jgi:hypothetical protein